MVAELVEDSCCSIGSVGYGLLTTTLLSGTVIGGCASYYSEWSSFDLCYVAASMGH